MTADLIVGVAAGSLTVGVLIGLAVERGTHRSTVWCPRCGDRVTPPRAADPHRDRRHVAPCWLDDDYDDRSVS